MPPRARNIASLLLWNLDKHKLLTLCMSIFVIVISLFLYVSIAQARYQQNLDRDLSLTVGGGTTTINYVPNDTKAGIVGHFESGKTGTQTMEQEKYRLFNVPATVDNHVDNPVPDNNLYKFEYWYALDSSNNEIAYKNLNSTVCDDDNWPPGNIFYAKFSIILGITFDSTSGYFEDGLTKQIVGQTAGLIFNKPANNPTWVVESLATNPEFDYWYEINEAGEHIQWTDEMFSRTVATDIMPRNNILYAEWKSDNFLVEFDAREDIGGHYSDGDFIKLVPQTEGNTFILPPDPENSTGTFIHWNLNKYVDDESTRITASSSVKTEHNHIRVYAHYTFDKHRVTVLVANPESGGKISWVEDGVTKEDTQTYYDAPDLIEGNKLHYSLTSSNDSGQLVGFADFSRNSITARVFSSSNDATLKFSRFTIEITQTGQFPGWEGDVNADITIKLYFVTAGTEAYWIYNTNTNESTYIDLVLENKNITYRIYGSQMIWYYDENYHDLYTLIKKDSSLSSALRIYMRYDSEDPGHTLGIPSDTYGTSGKDDSCWGYSKSSFSSYKNKVKRVTINPEFKNFPLNCTYNMFNGFGTSDGTFRFDAGVLNNISIFGVKSLAQMFYNVKMLPPLNLEQWDTRLVQSTKYLFGNCSYTSFNWVNLSNWKLNNLTDCSYMFYGCKSLEHIYIKNASENWTSQIGTRSVTSTNMFSTMTVVMHNWRSTNTQTILRAYIQDEVVTTANAGYFETWKG